MIIYLRLCYIVLSFFIADLVQSSYCAVINQEKQKYLACNAAGLPAVCNFDSLSEVINEIICHIPKYIGWTRQYKSNIMLYDILDDTYHALSNTFSESMNKFFIYTDMTFINKIKFLKSILPVLESGPVITELSYKNAIQEWFKNHLDELKRITKEVYWGFVVKNQYYKLNLCSDDNILKLDSKYRDVLLYYILYNCFIIPLRCMCLSTKNGFFFDICCLHENDHSLCADNLLNTSCVKISSIDRNLHSEQGFFIECCPSVPDDRGMCESCYNSKSKYNGSHYYFNKNGMYLSFLYVDKEYDEASELEDSDDVKKKEIYMMCHRREKGIHWKIMMMIYRAFAMNEQDFLQKIFGGVYKNNDALFKFKSDDIIDISHADGNDVYNRFVYCIVCTCLCVVWYNI